MSMERKQIYLDPGSDQKLKRLAKHRGVSQASLIREAIDAYLAGAGDQPEEMEGKNPLLCLVGMFRGDLPSGGASDHDRYLYRGEKEE